LHCPILALSQLSREVEKRSDKRPQLSDLRESGSIEQDADTVLFVYRDDYYLSREEPDEDDLAKRADWEDKRLHALGKAEVIVAKNRHGPTGIVHLAFDASLTRFSNLAREGRNG
jgi:replicative DNA helicase